MYPELSLVNLQFSLPLTSKQLICSLTSTHISFVHSFILLSSTYRYLLCRGDCVRCRNVYQARSPCPGALSSQTSVVMFLSAKRIVLTPLCLLNLLPSFQTQHKPHLLLTRPSPHFLWSTLSFYTNHFLINHSAISNILPDGLTPVML